MTLAATSTDVNKGGFWKLVLSFRFGEQNRDATKAKDRKIPNILKIGFRFGLLQLLANVILEYLSEKKQDATHTKLLPSI